MTPVQLPEVPEPVAWAAPLAFQNLKVSGHLGGVYGREWMWAAPDDGFVGIYTAAHLRAYATEAVMAERAALSRLADRWRRAADWLESSPMAVTQSGDLQVRTYRNLADELDAITQPEQNSGR